MTDEIRLAFAHPEERAIATMVDPLADRISLRDYVLSADIGAFQQERGRDQRLRFNVVVELRSQDAAGDDVDRILSYDTITDAIAAELAAERLNLLETLADRIAARILAEPQPDRVFVRIEKLDRGPGALGVEIMRRRDRVPPLPGVAVPVPVVVHVDATAVASPDLAEWLGALMAAAAPLVVTVGLPPGPRPPADGAPARQRIALLAIEQNAWSVAAADPRLTVVATRTELDWALRHGRSVVWAPSKMVLDTPGAPIDRADDGLALAMWLAEVLNASELVVHGSVSLPAISRVPVRKG